MGFLPFFFVFFLLFLVQISHPKRLTDSTVRRIYWANAHLRLGILTKSASSLAP